MAFAAWRAGVVKPAVASLTYFWSETVLARTVGALSLGVLAAGAVATTLLTESVLAPKSLARFWMAATSVAMILPGVAARLVSAVCSVVKAALIAVVAEASVKLPATSWLYRRFGRAWKLVTPPVPLPPPAAPASALSTVTKVLQRQGRGVGDIHQSGAAV